MSAEEPSVSPEVVAVNFVERYYEVLSQQPHRLHCFYAPSAAFSHSTASVLAEAVYGHDDIKRLVLELL